MMNSKLIWTVICVTTFGICAFVLIAKAASAFQSFSQLNLN